MKIIRCDENTLKDLKTLVVTARCPDGLTPDGAIAWGMRLKACEAVLASAKDETETADRAKAQSRKEGV